MKASLSQMQGLKDLISNDNFEFRIGLNAGMILDTKLNLKCINVSIPSVQIESMQINLWGHSVKHRGRRIEPQVIQATFYEDRNQKTLGSLRAWMSTISDVSTGLSSIPKYLHANYSELAVFDNKGKEISTLSVHGMYPENIDSIELNGSSSSPMIISVTFGYDYTILRNIEDIASIANIGLGSLFGNISAEDLQSFVEAALSDQLNVFLGRAGMGIPGLPIISKIGSSIGGSSANIRKFIR